MMADWQDQDPLLNSSPSLAGIDGTSTETKSYTRRWYVLGVFCLMTATQALTWNTWAPISQAAEVAFGWNDSWLALLTSWGPIMYTISTIFMAYLMDVKGLRWACVINALLMFIGTGLRCITSSPYPATWLIHIGQALNGIAGPVCQGAPPLISAIWFPVHQRTTATAIGAAFAGFGVAASFVLGPNLVPDIGTGNQTSMLNSSVIPLYNISNTTDTTVIRESIMTVMYIEFGLAAATFLLVLVYFPAKPPVPPSITASVERIDFKSGLKQLFRHKQFWNLGLVFAIATGVGIAWATVLDINLKPLGVTMWTAGMIGFIGTVVTQVVGLLVGFFSDIFAKKMKILLIVMLVVGEIMITLLALVCIGVIPFHIVWLYVTAIVGGAAINGTIPLFYELVCESTYPIAEGVTNGFLTWLNNFASLIFYVVLIAPIGTAWMNWFYVGAIALCIPLMIIYKENYNKLDIDTKIIENESPNIIDPAV